MSITELMNLLKKAKLLEVDRLSTIDFIDIVEKYHTSGSRQKLSEKISDEQFKIYIKANPQLLKVNVD
jgi:hypothetical protein